MKLAYSLTSSIIFFIIATITFVALKYTMSSKKPDTHDSSWQVTAGFIFITLLAQLIANFANAKAICQGSSQSFGLVLVYTFLPYFFILGSVMALIAVFPGWLSPFSNTIGYVSVSMLGLSGTFNQLLDTEGKGPLLTQICSDESLIINEMSKDNYTQFMAEMSKGDNILKHNYNKMPAFDKLYGLVLLKNIIAEGLWYMLAGCLAISIANNVIMNIQCDYDAKEMATMNQNIRAQQAKMHADEAKNKPVLFTKHT